jgi:hypothetical protein
MIRALKQRFPGLRQAYLAARTTAPGSTSSSGPVAKKRCRLPSRSAPSPNAQTGFVTSPSRSVCAMLTWRTSTRLDFSRRQRCATGLRGRRGTSGDPCPMRAIARSNSRRAISGKRDTSPSPGERGRVIAGKVTRGVGADLLLLRHAVHRPRIAETPAARGYGGTRVPPSAARRRVARVWRIARRMSSTVPTPALVSACVKRSQRCRLAHCCSSSKAALRASGRRLRLRNADRVGSIPN